MRYLIVDDDRTFRERLVEAIGRHGHCAAGAASAKDALAAIAAQPFDRAIIDLRMPGASGLELITALRESDAEIAIVVLTGYGSIATTQEAIRRGALSYLTKPAPVERILAAFEPHHAPTPTAITLPSLEEVEWEHVQRVLADCGWNVTKAAKLLGMDRRSLQRRLAKGPAPRN